MKKVLMGTAAIFLAASAAQAEVQFEKGTMDLNLGYIPDAPFTLFDGGAQVAFSNGNLGFQLDGGVEGITDFSDAESYGKSAFHLYNTTANGNKFGAYYSNQVFFSEVGAEAMMSFGDLDFEGSIGTFFNGPPSGTYNVSAEVFYAVNQNVEVNAGIDTYFSDSSTFVLYHVGGSYMLPDNGMSINAEYEGIEGDSIFKLGVSWSFGPNQDMRLFNDHGFDLFAS